MKATIPVVAIGALLGAGAAAITAKALVDERTPSISAPVVTGLSVATASASATYLTRGAAQRAFAGGAIGSIVAGAVLAARPQLLWNDRNGALSGVRRPERLVVIDPKVHAEGLVTRVSRSADGDLHIDAKPDPSSRQFVHGTRRPDTIAAEIVPNDQGRVLLPHVGDRIAVDGPLVWDSTHGWSEVHPVRDLTILKADGPRTPRDPKEVETVINDDKRNERTSERNAFIGAGIALAGVSLLIGGACRGVRAAGLLGVPATRSWVRPALLLTGGGATTLAGAMIGGQSED